MNFDTPVATLILMMLGTVGGLTAVCIGLLYAADADKYSVDGWRILLAPAGAIIALSSICCGMWSLFS